MLVLGHRGGRGEGWPPENSLEAFARAFDEGAGGVELDVRRCASGEVVLLHDASLEGYTNGEDRRRVHRVRRADLPRGVADLADALDVCHGRVVNVEVKADAPGRLALVRAVARVLARARPVEIVVSSFDPAVVLALGAFAPKIPRGMLIGRRTPRLAAALPLAMRRAIVAAHVEDSLVSPYVASRLVAAGLRLVAWTVNDPARAAGLRDLGVETIITDAPGLIVQALAAMARRRT